ncbi:MAG: ATP-binding cassette domain-containing protein [Mycoplasma sp.]
MTSNKKISMKLPSEITYWEKLAIWRKFATYNKAATKCNACPKETAHKTILLEDGRHICWYCWIKKDSNFSGVATKAANQVDIKKEKANLNKKPKEIENLTNEEEEILQKEMAKIDSIIESISNSENLMKLENGVVLEIDESFVENENVAEDIVTIKKRWIDETPPSLNIQAVLRKNNEKSSKLKTSYIKYSDLIKNIVSTESKQPELIIENEAKQTYVKHQKIEKKYIRLSDQPEKEKFSLTDAPVIRIEKGIPSFDENTKYSIEMINISKSFLNGKIIANDEITLRVKENEIHAIIGENGAGKSTLMSILFGIYTPDEGVIKINQQEVHFNSAMDASKNGLGMVHQHFQLVPTYSIFENVILGIETTSQVLGLIKTKEAREKVQALVEKYELNLDIDTKVSKLTVGQQQKTEILKLLYQDAHILIFDEPTAVLSPSEITQFLKMIKDLKEEGKTIILITHKFNEIKNVADRATIIRLGRFISDFNVEDKSIDEMAQEMVGKQLKEIKNNDNDFKTDSPILEVQNLEIKLERNKEKETIPLNFKVHAGEIFAIAGVEGNGQSELALALSGLSTKHKGQILFHNEDVSKYSIKKRYQKGLSFIPENRHEHGLILDAPIYMNTVSNLINKKPFSKFGFILEKNIKEHARTLIKEFDVRGSIRGSSNARGLSGGNQQKLIIARELSREHDLLIMVQPTRGLDLGAVKAIHEMILKQKEQGKAILLISYELDEILSLADTIAVMSGGTFSSVDSAKNITRQKIGQLMAGKE